MQAQLHGCVLYIYRHIFFSIKCNICPLLAFMSSLFFLPHRNVCYFVWEKRKNRTEEATVGFLHLDSHLFLCAGLLSLSQEATLICRESHTFLPWEMHIGGEIHRGMKSIVALQGTMQCGWKHTWNLHGAQWQLFCSKEIEVLSLIVFSSTREEKYVRNGYLVKPLNFVLCQNLKFSLEKMIWWDPDLLLPGNNWLTQGPILLLQHIIIFQL